MKVPSEFRIIIGPAYHGWLPLEISLAGAEHKFDPSVKSPAGLREGHTPRK
jgi:hypothetical protein